MGLQSGILVFDGSPIGLQYVSDGSPIRHVGLRWVSDGNNFFVNSCMLTFSVGSARPTRLIIFGNLWVTKLDKIIKKWLRKILVFLILVGVVAAACLLVFIGVLIAHYKPGLQIILKL